MRDLSRVKHIESVTIAAIAVSLLCYTTSRAIHLGITFDEALTFREFVPQSFWHIVTLDTVSANNHIFHTLLVKFFTSIFGDSTLVLRLPNLIGHAIFIFFTWRFSTKVRSAVPLFILLNVHLVLLEIFSLARGYGLAIGLMTASLWFLVQFVESRRLRNMNLCLISAVLCVYSNFSFLLVYVAIIGWLTLYTFQESDKGVWQTFRAFWNQWRSLAFFTVLLAILIVHPVKQLHRWDMFYYGGTTGFWHDTVLSVKNSMLYGLNPEIGNAIILAATALLLAVSVFTYFKGQSNFRLNSRNAVLIIFLFSAIISILQFYLFHTRFLIDRTALFLLPLFLVGIALLNSSSDSVLPTMRRITFSVVATAMTAHAFLFGNITRSTFWPGDSSTPEMVNVLLSDLSKSGSKSVTVGIRWKHDPCLRYYLESEYVSQIEVDSSWGASPNLGCDYYYLDESDSVFLREQGKIVIRRFESSGTVLAR